MRNKNCDFLFSFYCNYCIVVCLFSNNNNFLVRDATICFAKLFAPILMYK